MRSQIGARAQGAGTTTNRCSGFGLVQGPYSLPPLHAPFWGTADGLGIPSEVRASGVSGPLTFSSKGAVVKIYADLEWQYSVRLMWAEIDRILEES